MEAVGVVASIFGISSFALELTKTLYEFGDAVASAKEATDKIARNVSNYSGVLDLLLESLQNDEPLYTQRALKLADGLSEQSQTIFREIRQIVPGSPPWDGFKWRDKTRWAFRKSKVNALVVEIEHLKSTLNLLLQTMILARKTYLAPDKDQRYTIRAEQALYEQFKASEQLSMLQKQETEEDQVAGAMGKSSSTPSSTGALAAYKDPVLSAFQHEYLNSSVSPKDKAAQLRENSSLWLDRMRAEWFDTEKAESHLLLQLVIEDPRSSSGSRKEDEPKSREKYEEQIRQLREALAENHRTYSRDIKKLREGYEEQIEQLLEGHEERIRHLLEGHRRSEQYHYEARARLEEEYRTV